MAGFGVYSLQKPLIVVVPIAPGRWGWFKVDGRGRFDGGAFGDDAHPWTYEQAQADARKARARIRRMEKKSGKT